MTPPIMPRKKPRSGLPGRVDRVVSHLVDLRHNVIVVAAQSVELLFVRPCRDPHHRLRTQYGYGIPGTLHTCLRPIRMRPPPQYGHPLYGGSPPSVIAMYASPASFSATSSDTISSDREKLPPQKLHLHSDQTGSFVSRSAGLTRWEWQCGATQIFYRGCESLAQPVDAIQRRHTLLSLCFMRFGLF